MDRDGATVSRSDLRRARSRWLVLRRMRLLSLRVHLDRAARDAERASLQAARGGQAMLHEAQTFSALDLLPSRSMAIRDRRCFEQVVELRAMERSGERPGACAG